MNLKKEFVKAVMSVLRLDDNIYVIASIEEIIDRLEVSDYKMFIAYLGERNSDYEKPIQSIANAVEEFHRSRIEPTVLALTSKWETISKKGRSKFLVLETEKRMDNASLEKFRDWQKFNEENPDAANYDNPHKEGMEAFRKEQEKIIKEAMDSDVEEYKELFHKIGCDDMYNFMVDNSITMAQMLQGYVSESIFFDKLYKPSIKDKIKNESIEEASKATLIENRKIGGMVEKLAISREFS